MAKIVAKKGDAINATDTHIEMVPAPSGAVPTPTPHTFAGVVDGALSADVLADNQPVALDASTGTNQPAHIPVAGPFQTPPSNQATIIAAGATVFANNKPLARDGDKALTCNDPTDLPAGTVSASGTVLAGD